MKGKELRPGISLMIGGGILLATAALAPIRPGNETNDWPSRVLTATASGALLGIGGALELSRNIVPQERNNPPSRKRRKLV